MSNNNSDLTLPRDVLVSLLKSCAGVIERKPNKNPVFYNVLLQVREKELIMLASDQEITVSVRHAFTDGVPQDLLLPFRKMYEICRVLPEKAEVKFKVGSGNIVISAHKSKYQLTLLESEAFPLPEQVVYAHELSVPAELLAKEVDKVAFAMAEQDVRYFLNGMLFEVTGQGLNLVAADGHRLAVTKITTIKNQKGTGKFILPRKGVLELHRMLLEVKKQDVMLKFSPHYICAMSDAGCLTIKLLQGKFPAYANITSPGEKEMWVARTLFREALQRATALFFDKTYALQLQFLPGKVNILAKTAEKDQIEEELEVDYSGPEITIAFNGRYLLEVLQALSSEVIKMSFSSAASSVVMTAGDGVESTTLYVIMPLRV